MENFAHVFAVLDEVVGMEEFQTDSPRVRTLLANIEKLRSSDAALLNSFFSMLRSKVSTVAITWQHGSCIESYTFISPQLKEVTTSVGGSKSASVWG